jgi:hypothetical protein
MDEHLVLVLVLVRCEGCRSPIGRASVGSVVQLKCRHCGTRTMASV